MTSRRFLALATTAFLVLGGASLAQAADTSTPASSSSSSSSSMSSTATGTTGATTKSKTTHTAAVKPALPTALIGTPKTFQTTDNKSLVVQDSAGGWYKLDLTKACAALTGAQSIKITKSHRVYVGKKYCGIKDFAETTAPTAESTAPAAPAQ